MHPSIKNIAWLVLTAFLESLQFIIIVAFIYSFIPIPTDDFYSTLFPFMRAGIYQKRDMLFYRIFILTAIALQTGLLLVFRRSLNESRAMSKVRSWAAMSLIVLLPQLFLIYQVWLGTNPQLARQELGAVCALAVAVRVFWGEIYPWLSGLNVIRSIPASILSRKIFEKIRKDHQDAIVLVLLSWAFCIQVCLFVFAAYGWCFHHEPWPSGDLRNYEVLFMLCLIVSIAALMFFRHRGTLKGIQDRFAARTVVEGLLAFFLLNALFKMQVYYYQPQLAQRVYVILLGLTFLVKVFWREIERLLCMIDGLLMNDVQRSKLKTTVNWAFIVFIFLFLYVPDLEAAIARMYMGEQFHSIDVTLMNTGWAYHTGCKLDVDINNRYGLGMAVMVSQLTGLMGGFTYLNVFTIVMMACIVYFIAAYGLLRLWLNSVSMAMAGILICFKMQPFKEETASMYLTNPGLTVCRYFFDIPFLFMVLLFFRTSRKHFLLAAALICAVALFYESDTGMYLSMAFYATMILAYAFKEIRGKVFEGAQANRFSAALLLVPPLGALGLLRLTQGPEVFTSLFWHHMTEYISSQLWFGPIHIWETLRAHDVWLFGMGLWIIAVYVITMLLIGSLVFLKKIGQEHLFVVVLCVYGLALYHYYINRSAMTNCYKVGIPYVFILCYWVQAWGRRLSALGRRKLYLSFLGLCLYGLWTTHLTLAYPNVFNFSRNPAVDPLVAVKQSKGRLGYFNFLFIQYPDAFKLPKNNLGETSEGWRTEDDFKTDAELKEYFRRDFDFIEDASLIDQLIRPDEPVALISSFEVKILMQADRKPFFYIFPLVNSRPMRMRLFEVTHMWTTTDLKNTIKQLEEKKPAYVFMERIYLADEIPASFLYDMPPVCILDNYVRQHYAPYAYGKYLVAMKLR
jgi:hypothetical protein